MPQPFADVGTELKLRHRGLRASVLPFTATIGQASAPTRSLQLRGAHASGCVKPVTEPTALLATPEFP
jgi:hypothetical protein